MSPALLVLAKAPRPGRAKTRLTPPCTPEQAARLAAAALRDTLEAGLAVRAAAHVLVLDGEPGPWRPAGWDVVPQRAGGLGDRLAGAFADAGAPALLVGMDTPQVTPALLRAGLDGLAHADAVLGPARDGGFWAVGLRAATPGAFAGVPMSTPRTGAAQHARLRALGLRVGALPPLTDVDDIASARAVAAAAPGTAFAAALSRVEAELARIAEPAARGRAASGPGRPAPAGGSVRREAS